MNGAIKLTVALAAISAIVFSASIVFALNLEYRIETIPLKKFLLPNETIKLNVTLINRDVFSAKNTELKIVIGPRQYAYNIGDVESSGIYNTVIELPQFPPGTYTIKGIANYTELFDQRFVTETFNSFEVKFPEIERFPRSVYVKEFDLPDNITAGKSYTARLKVSNEGDVPADLIVEVNSLNDTVNIPKHLEPGQSDTIELNITFTSPGTGIAEGRIFAVINNQKYFLGFLSKQIFVKEAKIAKLFFDKAEFVDEPDNELNQIDDAIVKVYIKNIGDDIAASVRATMSSESTKIILQNPTADYIAILPQESLGKEFSIKTENADVGASSLNIKVVYFDNLGPHETIVNIPITIAEGRGECQSSLDCGSDEICTSKTCQKIQCGYCQYIKDHACQKYECCSDSECPSLNTCDTKLHICKPPQCTKDIECADNEICSFGGKCQKAFTLVVVPLGIAPQDESKYLKYATSEVQFFRDTSPLRESKTSQSKNLRTHYISTSLCGQSTKCSYESSYYCYEEMTECARRSGLLGIADKLVAIVDKNIGACGFAPMGGFYSINKLGCKGTPAHEIGHNLDLGHINCIANDRWTCIAPNAEDCNEADKSTDIMSYCFEDHYGPQAYRYMKNKYFTGFLEGS